MHPNYANMKFNNPPEPVRFPKWVHKPGTIPGKNKADSVLVQNEAEEAEAIAKWTPTAPELPFAPVDKARP